MAYDEGLADRVRELLATRTGFEERKMFGGLVFMVNTHMACGIVKNDLMVRVGKENHESALERGAQPMNMTGRTMPGTMIVVAAKVSDDVNLQAWVDEAVSVAASKPPKPPKT
jgi:TfoX/Sxy family transcriptional regulator of competence genes